MNRSPAGAMIRIETVELDPPSKAGEAEVEIRLLGGFAVRAAERDVTLLAPSRRVLAFLAVRRRRVRRSNVAGSLWPDSDERHAAANLRSALWRMGSLRGTALDQGGDMLWLGAGVSVDTEWFGRVTGTRDDQDIRPWGETLGALVTELLPDWDDDWLHGPREHWRQHRLHLLESLSRARSAEGDHWRAIEAALASVAIDSYRESAHRALIEAYIAEGNSAEAMRQYEMFAALLRSELGLSPSVELQGLVRDLAQQGHPDLASLHR